MAQTPKVWRELDEWMCHRLRAIQLKHWQRPRAIYRGLKALGAAESVAKRVAGAETVQLLAVRDVTDAGHFSNESAHPLNRVYGEAFQGRSIS